jgi:hypothetical protein
LGLWPGFRYLFSKDPKAKVIGIIAIVLTIVSLVVTIWATANYLTSQLNNLNSVNSLNY